MLYNQIRTLFVTLLFLLGASVADPYSPFLEVQIDERYAQFNENNFLVSTELGKTEITHGFLDSCFHYLSKIDQSCFVSICTQVDLEPLRIIFTRTYSEEYPSYYSDSIPFPNIAEYEIPRLLSTGILSEKESDYFQTILDGIQGEFSMINQFTQRRLFYMWNGILTDRMIASTNIAPSLTGLEVPMEVREPPLASSQIDILLDNEFEILDIVNINGKSVPFSYVQSNQHFEIRTKGRFVILRSKSGKKGFLLPIK
jgi:hypothetical protein